MKTVVLIHRKENLKKCSIWPLHTRPDFEFHFFPYEMPPLHPSRFIRLGMGGPPLRPADRTKDLLILDATWRLVQKMEDACSEIPIRSIGTYRTAYPRVSDQNTDPSQGLATIEALYCAHLELGLPTDGLLKHYHWGAEFLRLNGLEER
ncbi:MAG: hypothetical protein VX278_12450 [Myxococcota bacterium]|nr:hypothetical protein [Myxococcota bacterium]